MDLQEAEERWIRELENAENLLDGDPTAAQDIHREVVAAVEGWIRSTTRSERHRLDSMLVRARAAFSRSAQASRRFQADAAARERRFHAREHETATLPMAALRKPWPATGRPLTS
jgi:hypothetical protein